MSKTFNQILLILAAVVLILQFFTFIAAGQDISATLSVDTTSPNIVHVDGKFGRGPEPGSNRNLSFLLDYAGITGLGERVSNVSLKAADGSPVKFRRFVAGEYVAETDFSGWSYTLDLTPLKNPTAAGHLSWLTPDGGILFLGDILPQTREISAAKVLLKITHSGKTAGPWVDEENTFEYKDKDSAVIPLRPTARSKSIFAGKTHLILSIVGNWKFTDEAASKMATEIFASYEQMFGSTPLESVKIIIQPFPIPVAIGNYEADTRGNSITIISSDMPFESQSLQTLHEQLRHEIFHLWFPNGVDLSGKYDWFYEGFALYQSLKLGVAVNRIRFEDYLDTLSRAYNIDSFPSQRMSLLDASKNRWSGANMQVYSRGMLVAFLCDLALLEASKGKTTTDDLVRGIYNKYHSATAPTDGNTAVLNAMRTHQELRFIAEHYISGADKIEWNALLAGAGIEAVMHNSTTVLSVVVKPGGRQKDLLDKLGYNNWRKLNGNNR